jgi:hypothetical protein
VGKGGEILVVFRQGNLKERDNLEDLSKDGKIKLKWVLKKQNQWAWTGLIWLRTGRRAMFLWDDKNLRVAKKGGGILHLLKPVSLLK